jgi:pimeloyl-ACP methyl ester carboxylesterase
MNPQRELSAPAGAAASRPVASAAVAAEHRGGSGPPLLLLHGITASFRVWEPVLPALEEHHEVFAPTLAGHYGAAALHDGVLANVESLTDRLEERLDELEIARPHVVGNSLGGWLALELPRRGRASSVVAL